MPTRSAIELFTFRGIRVGVDYSWFLVLFLVIISLSGFFKDVLGTDQDAVGPYVLAVISALAFFGSILLHELGHAVVALREGIGITGITLWLFGGVARMSRDTDSPGAEFRIAVAGPVVTLVIAAGCLGAGFAIGGEGFWDALRFDGEAGLSGALAVLAWVTVVNVFVLAFNLIPAFPLDGGRIARAAAWRLTGDRARATRIAATMGQGFAYVFMGLGIYLLVVEEEVISGIWLALVGFILGSAARGAVAQTELTKRIEGITVADVMDAEPVAIPEGTSVERALEEFFLRYRWPWFPVVDTAQRLTGLIHRGAADAVPEGRRSTALVNEFLTAGGGAGAGGGDEALGVSLDAPIESLLGNDQLRRLGGLPAVDADGRLRGVITAEQVGRALRNALADG
ncbi:MAG: site-2 protease family protein [Solirubrobacterales bacterium]